MALYSEMQKRALVFYVQHGTTETGLPWGSATVYTLPTGITKTERAGIAGEPVSSLNVEPQVGKALEQMPLPCVVRFGLEVKPIKKKSGAATSEIVAVECEILEQTVGKFQEFARDLFGAPKTAAVPPPIPGMTINKI